MSLVAVHGPNMWGGTGAGGGGTGAVVTAPQVKATADMTNGLKFTFEATDKTRVAADYDWAFPADGTPATAADNKGPIVVTYAAAGAKTATLTIAAGAGPPAGGSYPITVQAIGTGAPRMVQQSAEEPLPEEEEPAFDPADYTVAEVVDYASVNPDEIEAIIAAEQAGKNRSTLLSQLNALWES